MTCEFAYGREAGRADGSLRAAFDADGAARSGPDGVSSERGDY